MSVVFSYPSINSGDLQSADRFIISQMNVNGNPTKSVTLGQLASYLRPSPYVPPIDLVTGSGINNYIVKWTDGPNSIVGDSKLFDNTTDVQCEVNFVLKSIGTLPSTGSVNLDFKGIDDLGTELVGGRIFTTDSSVNPSGQDFYFQNADDNGLLQTNLFIDAFGFTGIGNTSPNALLDVSGDFENSGNVKFTGYGSGTKTGTATYSLAVDASGNIIEETVSGSGVTSIIAGTNVTISPVGGTGDVTVNASGGGGGVGSTIDYTLSGNGYTIRVYIENVTVGSPDFGQAYASPQLIAFQRQSAGAATQGGLPFNLFYNRYTPALDPGYDAGGSCGTANMCMLPMIEESTADINTLNSGSNQLGAAWQIFSTDVAALNSYRMPLRMRVDNAGASPGNGTIRMTLIDGSNNSPNPVDDATALPSTVSVYFRDTTLTTSKVAGPPFNLLWAGADTQFAQTQNGGAAYINSLDYVFTGNGAGDINRKYELFFQDEYNAYNRCSYLKVTDGRVVFQDLPTADPVSKGVLWNDAGTLKISLG